MIHFNHNILADVSTNRTLLDAEWTWLTEQIAVGGVCYSEAAIESIVAEGFTHVIDCRSFVGDSEGVTEALAARGVDYVCIGTHDDGERKGEEWFAPIVSYGLQALTSPSARLLIHCASGHNRGPSAAYAIMRASGSSMEDSYYGMKAKRSVGLLYAIDAEIYLQNAQLV